MNEQGDHVVRVAEDVVWLSGASRVIAMNPAREQVVPFVLKDSAAAVWEEVARAGSISLDALVNKVSRVFDMDQAEIRDDIQRLVFDLCSRDLLAGASRYEVDGAATS